MQNSKSSNPKEKFQKQTQRPQPSTSPNSSGQAAANQRGEALAAAMRKLPDNPQVEY